MNSKRPAKPTPTPRSWPRRIPSTPSHSSIGIAHSGIVKASTMARPAGTSARPIMPKIMNPAICNCPTQNRPSRSPRSGSSRSPITSSAGAITATVPTRRSSTKDSGGASARASFISGQLPAQPATMIARYR